MQLTEELLKRNRFNVHYWTGGKAGAPLVVFSHGATVDHHEWDATLPLVAEHFRVLTWDLRGHGLSRPSPFTLKAAVDDLIAILEQMQVQQAVFVGHSMGGNLHQELVFQHPDRVKAMVFLDCTWNFLKPSALESLSLSVAEPISRSAPFQTLKNQSPASTADSKASQDLFRPAMENLIKSESTQTLKAGADRLPDEPGYTINKPLLLMVGDKDSTGNIRKIMPVWAKQEPDCQFIVIPNAMHAANLDNPDFFHKALIDFLKNRCQ